jgi:hypothetical protein
MLKSFRFALRHIFGSEAPLRRRRIALIFTLTGVATIAASYSALAGQGPSQWCSDNYNNSEVHLLNSPATFNLEPGSSFGNPDYFMTCYSTTPYGSGDTEASGQVFVVYTPTLSGTSAACYSDSAALVRVDCFYGVGINASNPTSPSAGYTVGSTTFTVAGTPVSTPGHSVGAGVGCVGGTIAISATSCANGSFAGISGTGNSTGYGYNVAEFNAPGAAVSGTGCANGVVAISLTSCANGDYLAVSGLGSAYGPGWTANFSPVCPSCQPFMGSYAVGGGSATANNYAVSAGNANSYGISVSGIGNASSSGVISVSGIGNAGGWYGYNPRYAASGTGSATGEQAGVSGTGCAGGYQYLAASGTGCANGGLVSVSGTNNASGGSVLRVSGGEKDVSVEGINILDNGNPPPPSSLENWNGFRECPIFNNPQESQYVLLTKTHSGWAEFIENGQVKGTLLVKLVADADVASARSDKMPYCGTLFFSSFTYTDAATNVTREIPYGSFTSDGATSARLDYVSADFEIHLTWAGGSPSLYPGPYIDSNHLDCNHWADNPSTQVTVRADNAVVTGAVRGAGGNPLSAKPLQGTGWQSSGEELATCI